MTAAAATVAATTPVVVMIPVAVAALQVSIDTENLCCYNLIMMKTLLFIPAMVALVGCAPEPVNDVDQCKREELFKQCLSILPAGPNATVYNDWSEVVSECRDQAYYTSIRPVSVIKPECRSH